ncbi:unnamed protein product [Paramecium sonneborni]|uniref:Uncharacterized protein n=1 Tax=Paramecium sonneborni TaxID=65129 RepID=A0A8S1RR50_9CILI|nr:unnamed protein product [Paramecium sonneborni]
MKKVTNPYNSQGHFLLKSSQANSLKKKYYLYVLQCTFLMQLMERKYLLFQKQIKLF